MDFKSWKLVELLDIKYGKEHKRLADGPIPVYGLGGLMRHVEKSLYEKESILIPRKGSLNNIYYTNQPFWVVDTMFYTKIQDNVIGKFLYFYLKTIDFAAMNVGSAVPSLTIDILNNLNIELPPDQNLKRFSDVTTPIFARMDANETENQTLTTLRDCLLPKLMRGEIAF